MVEPTNNIPIRNIYYMLAYVYQTIELKEYKQLTEESFHQVKDLYAQILLLGVPALIRGGLKKDYKQKEDITSLLRGKINLNQSIKEQTFVQNKLVINYDEFSEDIIENKIIKSTLLMLVRDNSLLKEKRKKLRSFSPFFGRVTEIPLQRSAWKKIHYNRQNIRYQFILEICLLLFEEKILATTDSSRTQDAVGFEKSLFSLFEKFVYAFYKEETNYKVTRPQIPWQVDSDFQEALPVMQTDMVLQNKERTLIIDTKFYEENMSRRFKNGSLKHLSGNLYQLFTYLNNWPIKEGEELTGILLYAKTTAKEQPNHTYSIKGKKMKIVTVDLSRSFEKIKEELLGYVI